MKRRRLLLLPLLGTTRLAPAQSSLPNQVKLAWTRLSALPPVESRVGYDKLYVGDVKIRGNPVRVNRRIIRDCLWAHAPSMLAYNLSRGKFQLFRGKVGLEDGLFGEVQFRILGDGKELWKSQVIAKKAANKAANDEDFLLDVRGIERLELHVDNLGNGDSDHSIWINPELGQ